MARGTANLQIRFARPPVGRVDETHFEMSESTVPRPADGQVLVRNVWLSVDPYQRRQMMADVRYAQPLRPGDVMVGRTMGRVVSSRSPLHREGDWVRGSLGWQQYSLASAEEVETIDLDGIAPSAYLGALGSPGVTAWLGLRRIAGVKAGDTVVVSAAVGAVGSVAGQLARLTGCRTIGIAGGPRKCAAAVADFGYDLCLDYKDAAFSARLAHAVPQGIDVDFENVGGSIFDAVLPHLNDFARIALCGLVSQYNLIEPYGMRNVGALLNRNVMLQGFRVTNYPDCRQPAMEELKQRVKSGELVLRESVVHGLAQAPAAFVGMLGGANIGKQLVRIGDDDA